jgi:hypothetical protein
MDVFNSMTTIKYHESRILGFVLLQLCFTLKTLLSWRHRGGGLSPPTPPPPLSPGHQTTRSTPPESNPHLEASASNENQRVESLSREEPMQEVSKSLDNATYWKPGHCIPKAGCNTSIRDQIEVPKWYVQYMRDHAVIGKFLGIWPTERDLLAWINSRWKPTCHIEIKLGSKGFFTVIFENEKEREHIFEGGPYFF